LWQPQLINSSQLQPWQASSHTGCSNTARSQQQAAALFAAMSGSSAPAAVAAVGSTAHPGPHSYPSVACLCACMPATLVAAWPCEFCVHPGPQPQPHHDDHVLSACLPNLLLLLPQVGPLRPPTRQARRPRRPRGMLQVRPGRPHRARLPQPTPPARAPYAASPPGRAPLSV
jgi:hypothetical protein